MGSYPLTWLDVFTAMPLAGNQLAVVHDADGLDDATMLAFARETNLSETTFVQTAEAEGAAYRNRIWTLDYEMRFAGHPTLGTAVAVAHRQGKTEARYVQQTIAGLQPVDVRREGARWRGSMLQNPAEIGDARDAQEVFSGVGLSEAAGDAGLEPRIVSTGHAHLIAPVADPEVLARVRPDAVVLAGLLQRTGAATVYLACCDPASETARARAFYTYNGVVREDPATGSAAGPLTAYLHARTGLNRLLIDQGVEMGRASRLECSIEGDHIRVGGDCVVVAEGHVTL